MKATLRREISLLLRSRASFINPIAFFLLSIMLFAIAAPEALSEPGAGKGFSGAGILWTLVLLAQLLSLDGMYRRDYDSGALEQTLVNADVPFVAVLTRIVVQWLASGGLITLCIPLTGPLVGLPWAVIPAVMLALLLGTPTLALLGSIGAGITVGFARGGMVLALLVLPLFLPVLIFGTDLINSALVGASYRGQALWLAIIGLAALMISPFATLAGLRISVQMQ